jgi:broad specificity polyphosphatase/5'/3'-nucleotidase SurE
VEADAVKKKTVFRPDLTEYQFYVDALVDRLNQDAAYRMTRTDAVKMAIEQACKRVIPDVVVKPCRKRYVTLKI